MSLSTKLDGAGMSHVESIVMAVPIAIITRTKVIRATFMINIQDCKAVGSYLLSFIALRVICFILYL